MARFTYCVIGGGIVGLSTAHHLLETEPDATVVVLEAAQSVASHQTGHNSGVIHSGIYYEPGSLKARFCKAGERATKEFCTEHGIPFDECGKLIVATTAEELARMTALEDRAEVNGIACRRVGGDELTEMEPNVVGLEPCISRRPASSTTRWCPRRLPTWSAVQVARCSPGSGSSPSPKTLAECRFRPGRRP